MKILKYCMAPILFLMLMNWYTGFTLLQLEDIQVVMIIIFATGILILLGSETGCYKSKFRNSIMIVGFLLTCMELFTGLGKLNNEYISLNVMPDYIKPMLLCLVLYPPLSLIAESYDSSQAFTGDSVATEERLWEEILSRREREVLALVQKDMTNGEIAEKLFISELTVKKHVYNIMKKVGVSSRDELM